MCISLEKKLAFIPRLLSFPVSQHRSYGVANPGYVPTAESKPGKMQLITVLLLLHASTCYEPKFHYFDSS